MATSNVWKVIGADGATLEFRDVDGTGTLYKDGVEVSSFDTLTAAEIGYLDGALPGTVVTEKCVVYSGSDEIAVDTLTGVGGISIGILNIAQFAQASKRGVAINTATNVLGADHGKTFFLDSATGFASTLPTPAIGLMYRFVVKTAPTSGNHTVVSGGGADIIYGTITSSAASSPAGAPASAEDSINFVANTALPGDWIQLECDGTNWYVSGTMSANGGITATAA